MYTRSRIWALRTASGCFAWKARSQLPAAASCLLTKGAASFSAQTCNVRTASERRTSSMIFVRIAEGGASLCLGAMPRYKVNIRASTLDRLWLTVAPSRPEYLPLRVQTPNKPTRTGEAFLKARSRARRVAHRLTGTAKMVRTHVKVISLRTNVKEVWVRHSHQNSRLCRAYWAREGGRRGSQSFSSTVLSSLCFIYSSPKPWPRSVCLTTFSSPLG